MQQSIEASRIHYLLESMQLIQAISNENNFFTFLNSLYLICLFLHVRIKVDKAEI